jgi:hypothetical protein
MRAKAERQTVTQPFSVEEVAEGISRMKLNKAEGIDRIRNEHIIGSPMLWAFIAFLFSVCMKVSDIPEIWRTCLLSVIPKGKGDINSPASWRGISMKCALGKLLSLLMVERLLRFLLRANAIPEEQHGFLRHRSTETALAALRKHVEKRTDAPKKFAYTAFIDFRAAFDTASRVVIVEKLARMGVPSLFLRLLMSMLQRNMVFINDGVRLLHPFWQTTGLPQGDNLSSILFVVLLHDLPKFLKEKLPDIDIVLYADDIALVASSIEMLRRATEALMDFCEECGLHVNAAKTKAMKFRRGGRMAASDRLCVRGSLIEFVPCFTYLGFVLTPTLSSFTKHLQNRRIAAIRGLFSLPDLSKLSLHTGLRLFNIKIAPCVVYGIRQIWTSLSKKNMQAIDSVKTTYLKRLLGISKYTRNRITYLLAGCKVFIEEIQEIYQLEKTDAYLELVQEQCDKFEDIDLNIFETPPFQEEQWRLPLDRNRSLKCRVAAHGFHHRYCYNTQWHDANSGCQCRYCQQPCSQYHILTCRESPYENLEQHNN